MRRQELLDCVGSLPPPGVPAQLTVPCPPPSWRPPLQATAARRYQRELLALKAEAGISAESSDDDAGKP